MKKILVLVLLSAMTSNIRAQQISSDLLQSNDSKLLEHAIDGGFFFITQSYQLYDNATDKYYGLKGKDEFGETTQVAIRLNNGVIVMRPTVEPWEEDPNFREFSKKYQPVLFQTHYSSKAGEYVLIQDAESIEYEKIADGLAYYVSDFLQNDGSGFRLHDNKNTDGESWVVWITASDIKNALSANSTLHYTIRKASTSSTDDSLGELKAPQGKKNVMGGCLVNVRRLGFGNLDITLEGVLVKDKGVWKVIEPNFIPTKPSEQSLTPSNSVREKKDKKKTKK